MNSRKIQIPEPCRENPDRMEETGGGLFCSSCQHLVQDFTDWKEEEILAYLRFNSGKKNCIIIKDEFLKPVAPQNPVKLLRVAALAFLGFFFFRNEAQAQKPVQVAPDSTGSRSVRSDSIVWVVRGTVKLDKSKKRPGGNSCKVTALDGAGNMVTTVVADRSGNFELHLPAANKQEQFTLIFSARGYKTYRFENFTPSGKPVLGIRLRRKKDVSSQYAVIGCPSF